MDGTANDNSTSKPAVSPRNLVIVPPAARSQQQPGRVNRPPGRRLHKPSLAGAPARLPATVNCGIFAQKGEQRDAQSNARRVYQPGPFDNPYANWHALLDLPLFGPKRCSDHHGQPWT